MATITLTGNTTYSTLAVANGDTINLNGFALTIGAQPSETNITVNTPGKAGTVVISGAYDLSTWSLTAGTATLITTLPAGCSVGSITGGSATSAYGVNTSNGTIGTATGGSGTQSFGVNNNLATGLITQAVAGTGTAAHGCQTNSGNITSATAGGTFNVYGCNVNRGTIQTASGGSAGFAFGNSSNLGTIILANGGTNATAYGCNENFGHLLKLLDSTATAVSLWFGAVKFVFGPDIAGVIKSPVNTIYSLGALNPLATIPVGATVVELSEGGASGFTGIMSNFGRLGT